MDTNRELVRGLSWSVLAAVMTALFMVPWKLSVQYGPESSVVLVMLVSAALFNSIGSVGSALVRRRPLRLDRIAIGVALALSVLTFLGNIASAAAIARIGGPLLSLLQRLEVVIVALGAWAMLGERVDGRFWLGVVVAALGLWFIGAEPEGGQLHADGMLYGLASALAFGSMNIVIRKYANAIDPVTVNALRLWLAVGLWFAVQGRVPDAASLHPALVGYAALAALSGPVCGRLSIMYALRHVEARLVVLCLLSSPLLTLIVSWWLLDHWPGPQSLWGGLLMLVGIAIPVALHLRAPGQTAAATASGRG